MTCRTTRHLAALLGLILLLATTGAQAEESAAQRAQPHVDTAQAAFNEERYEVALREFRAARELVAQPLLTYNIALCLERSGELREAIDEYQRYLREEPEARNSDEIRERIEDLHRQRVEERDRAVDVEAADRVEPNERRGGRGLLDPDTRHELDLVIGTAVSLTGLRANAGSAALSLEFDYHYRLTPTWHVGAAFLYDGYYRSDDVTTGDTEQRQVGAMASGRYARTWLEGRLEVRATAGLGYEFLKRDHGQNRHWIFTRLGGVLAWAFWRGVGIQLNMGFRLGVLAGGDDPDSAFGMSFDALLGMFIAF